MKEMKEALEKINQNLELLANPVFLYDRGGIKTLTRQPGAVFPICKCGGLGEEKRDD